MKAISFELSGKTACFRKPDVNQFAYFTYNNIHKPALLGLLGAILGLKGHIQLSYENRCIEEENRAIKKKADKKPLNSGFPEFYEKLKDLKISITPLASYGYFSKKIQVFNNSVGYASKEMGGNLIVREQWLEEPKWQIVILDDGSKEYEQLKEYLLKGKAVFLPYLGKNDHPASIDKVEEIRLTTPIDGAKISSLFIEDVFEISKMPPRGELSYFFKEVSPMRLQKEHHFYEYENLIFTNHRVVQNGSKNLFSFEEKNYFFL